MTTSLTVLSRADAETFLFAEAELLDTWKLEAWAELFTPDGQYLIPPLDAPDSQRGTALFLVYDDRHRLQERAHRLLKRTAHAEFPHAKVRHLIANVRVGDTADGVTKVSCNFVVYRSRNDHTEVFPGHAEYELVVATPQSIRIRSKRVVVDTDTLRDQRRISIIL